MAKNTSDILVDTLIEWGVEVIFGIPGDGINGIIESLRKAQDKIRFIQVRHEESAAFAACGYAKFTGRLGVCIATSGPGGIHLLNGLYDAKLDGQPVLAITGLQYHDLINTRTQQDIELDKLFENVSEYNCRIMGPAHVKNATELAIRCALERRGVAHITLPVDIQVQEHMERSDRNIPKHTHFSPSFSGKVPNENSIIESAKILNEGKRVAILAGRGAIEATSELEEIADLLGAPIIKALLGKAAVPDDSPYTTGGIGLLGTKPSAEAMKECDTLLIVGSSFPYIEFMPKPGQARAVQIDIDATRIGLRYPVEIGLIGESADTLKALIKFIKPRTDKSFLEKAQKNMDDWRDLMEERETTMAKPMKPQFIAAELGKRLKENAIVTCDSGTIATWWARHIPVKRGQKHSLSGNLASMANGFPYAIAAQIAFPERQVVAFVGDGGFSMLMAELATCVKYKLPIKIVIIKNNSLGQIKWEQIVFLGNPEYVCDLQPINFVKLAEAFEVTGVTIDEPEQCASQLDIFLDSPDPIVFEAIVDPYEPPMPAEVTLKQAAHFAESLAKGEPERKSLLKTVLIDKVRELT